MRRTRRFSERITTFGEPPAGLEPTEPPDPNAHLQSRVCADREAWAVISTMITMSDSRVICKTCWRGLQTRKAKQAQGDMFAPAQTSLCFERENDETTT